MKVERREEEEVRYRKFEVEKRRWRWLASGWRRRTDKGGGQRKERKRSVGMKLRTKNR